MWIVRRKSEWWLSVLWVAFWVACGAIAGSACRGCSTADAQAQTSCHPAEAHSTAVWYVPAGHNTAVTLIAYCDGIPPTAWSISFFEGEQPSLWDWWEIQNTASELLRGH